MMFFSISLNNIPQENDLSGFWKYQNEVIHIFDDNTFEWVSFGSNKRDSEFGKYLYSYKIGRVSDYTLLFEKTYTLTPEQMNPAKFLNPKEL